MTLSPVVMRGISTNRMPCIGKSFSKVRLYWLVTWSRGSSPTKRVLMFAAGAISFTNSVTSSEQSMVLSCNAALLK